MFAKIYCLCTIKAKIHRSIPATPSLSPCDGENVQPTPIAKSNLLCKKMKMPHTS